MQKIKMSLGSMLLYLLLVGNAANAMDVNIGAALSVKTIYEDCQYIAEKIVQLANRFVGESNDKKQKTAGEIKKQEKRLKKCEKSNRKGSKKKLILTISRLAQHLAFNEWGITCGI